jgi:hypothetical protein
MALLILSVSLLTQSGQIGWSDGISMYQVAKSVVEDGDVAISRGVVWRGHDGRYYSPFGLGLSLVAIPPYAAIQLARRAVPIPESVAQGFISLLMPLILALLAMAVYRLARRLDGTLPASLLVATGVIVGTLLLVYGKVFSSEPLAALLLVVAIERSLALRPLSAGAAAAGAALSRPQFFAFVPILLWGLWRHGRLPAVFRAAVPVTGALLIQVLYNLARFRDPLNFGYSTAEVSQGFTTPILEGSAGLLFNGQKSLFIFAPILAILPLVLRRLWSTSRSGFWLIAGLLVITFLMSATWWDWGGGWVWGPRLLIPAIPAAVAPVAGWIDESKIRRLAVGGLLALGLLVNLPATVTSTSQQLSLQPHPARGPEVIRQYGILLTAFGFRGNHLPADEATKAPSSLLDLWQVKVSSRLGLPGLGFSLLVTLSLTGVAVFSAIRLMHCSLNGSRA